MTVLPLILLSVILNATAQLLLKAGMNRVGTLAFSWNNIVLDILHTLANPFILLGLAIYGLAVVVWLFVLSRAEVGMAYPMTSLAYIVTAFAAYFFFQEGLSLLRLVGIGVVMLGVYLIAQT